MTARTIALITLLAGCGDPAGTPAPDAAPVDDGSATPDGARVYVHLRANGEPVEHTPGTAGQTPRDWLSGVRSLHLLRTRDDPDPVLIFSHGDGYVEASYADGADTVVGSAPIESLEPRTYTWARAVHTHVRFTVDVVLHSGFGPMAGEARDLVVLSDRTTIDGVERSRGFYRYVFTTAGTEYPLEGSDPSLTPMDGGGFDVEVEDGETAYYFPALVETRDDLTGDVHLIFEVNVHQGFRWQDQDEPGYAEGVFDASTSGTEPVTQTGANTYRHFLE